MGVHKLASNKKKTAVLIIYVSESEDITASVSVDHYAEAWDHLRRRDKSARLTYNRVKNLHKIISEIPDIDIVPDSTIKQRKLNSRTNVTISGKKKRKIMKQLKRLDKKNRVPKEVDMEATTTSSKVKKSKKSKKPKKKKKENEEEEEEEGMETN